MTGYWTTSFVAWEIKSRRTEAPGLILVLHTESNEGSSLRHCATRKVRPVIISLSPIVPTLWFRLPASLISTYNGKVCSCELGTDVGWGHMLPYGAQAAWALSSTVSCRISVFSVNTAWAIWLPHEVTAWISDSTFPSEVNSVCFTGCIQINKIVCITNW